jgi:hypothetical protein
MTDADADTDTGAGAGWETVSSPDAAYANVRRAYQRHGLPPPRRGLPRIRLRAHPVVAHARPPGEPFNKASPRGRKHHRAPTSTQRRGRACTLQRIPAGYSLEEKLRAVASAADACIADVMVRRASTATDYDVVSNDLAFREAFDVYDYLWELTRDGAGEFDVTPLLRKKAEFEEALRGLPRADVPAVPFALDLSGAGGGPRATPRTLQQSRTRRQSLSRYAARRKVDKPSRRTRTMVVTPSLRRDKHTRFT